MRSIKELVAMLKADYAQQCNREQEPGELEAFSIFCDGRDIRGGEYWLMPEDNFYEPALKLLEKADVLFDLGAGDLQFALLASERVKLVYAIEINPTILGRALTLVGLDLPKNVIPICGDGFTYPLPGNVTKIACLMIHRGHDFSEAMLALPIIWAAHVGLCQVGTWHLPGGKSK